MNLSLRKMAGPPSACARDGPGCLLYYLVGSEPGSIAQIMDNVHRERYLARHRLPVDVGRVEFPPRDGFGDRGDQFGIGAGGRRRNGRRLSRRIDDELEYHL